MYNIAFPSLGLYFNINPIAFSIGNIDVYWYGIIIATSVIVGLIIAKLLDGKYNIKYETVEEFVLWAIPVAIIFARLYYVGFSWNAYKDDLVSIFKIWNGGLAIYGGIVGAILTAFVYCNVKKIRIFDLTDYCIPLLALGQAIGRWGNFVNREAYGTYTNNFFRMELLQKSGEYISVHPTFLYESLGLLVIFIVLMIKNRKFSGEKTALYFFMYGILRAGVEWLRADSLMLFNVKVSFVLSCALSVVSLILLIIGYIRIKKENIKECKEE